MDRKIIKRVKLLTGKNLEFRPMEFGTGTTFIIDGVSKNFPNSLWVEYKQFINYYDIDYISEFTNMIIKEFKLKSMNKLDKDYQNLLKGILENG